MFSGVFQPLQWYLYTMSFWENVERELEYQGISRKELASETGMSYNNIGNGIKRNAMPGADTALKISKALGVSIDYLLCDETTEAEPNGEKRTFALLNKYKSVLHDLEKLPSQVREPIIEMINRIARNK